MLVLYALAALLNIGVPRRAARLPVTRLELRPLLQDFRQSNRQLWLDPLGGLSLAVTTLFWGMALGLLVVPMNALLQYRGHRLLSPGRSIAVQGFNENLSVLVMLGLYTLLLWLGLPIVPLMVGFGLLLAAGMAGLMLQLRLKRA